MKRRKTKPTTDKQKCDLLWRRLVTKDGQCERCLKVGPVEAAHIIRRRRSGVRCVEDNGWALDRFCHEIVDENPAELVALVEKTIGRDRYHELFQTAEEHTRNGASAAAWWRAERERLEARCREEGIPTTWTVKR